MAKFTLTRCKLREDKFVPVKGAEPQVWDWPKVVEVLAPSQSPRAFRTLRAVRPQSYICVYKHPKSKRSANLLFQNADPSSNSARFILRKDPTFGDRLEHVFRVEDIDWEFSFEEVDPPPKVKRAG